MKNPTVWSGEFLWRAQKDWTPLPTQWAGIPLSTRDDLAVLRLPNLLRIEP